MPSRSINRVSLLPSQDLPERSLRTIETLGFSRFAYLKPRFQFHPKLLLAVSGSVQKFLHDLMLFIRPAIEYARVRGILWSHCDWPSTQWRASRYNALHHRTHELSNSRTAANMAHDPRLVSTRLLSTLGRSSSSCKRHAVYIYQGLEPRHVLSVLEFEFVERASRHL